MNRKSVMHIKDAQKMKHILYGQSDVFWGLPSLMNIMLQFQI